MTTDLRTRLLAHAAVHDACTSEHSDEQAQWAMDLREAAALLAPSTSPAAAALAAAVDDSLGLVTLPPIRVDRATHASLMEAAKSRGVILQALVRERLAPYATPPAAAAVAGEPNRAKTNAINLAHLRQVMARWHEQACELGFDGVADVLASIAAEQVGRWVPLKPTAEMVLALLNAPEIEDARSDIESMWAAMLAAAPHPSPSAAGRLAPVGWQERQATRGGWSAWYDVDKVPSVAFMAARDNYQWRRVFASTSPAIAHVIALGSPDDLITVANVTLEDSGPTLTLHFDQLGDMGSILGEKEATYTVRIAPMRRGDFDDLGEFDGF